MRDVVLFLSPILSLILFSGCPADDDDASSPAGDDDSSGLTGTPSLDDTPSNGTPGDDDSSTMDTETPGDDDSTVSTQPPGDDDSSGDDDMSTPLSSTLTPIPVDEAGVSRLEVVNAYGSIALEGDPTARNVSWEMTCAVPIQCQKLVTVFKVEGSELALWVEPAEEVEGANVTLRVVLPALLPVGASVSVGTLSAEGLNGGLEAAVVTGDIEGTDLMGDIAVTTGTGDIALDSALLPGGFLHAVVMTGNIALTIPSSTSAFFTATTGSGAITIQGLSGIIVMGGVSAMGTLGTGNGTITLTTGKGNISAVGVSGG